MSGIRSTNTKPEMVLRQGLHKQGFRYRLHRKTLTGKPDLVFPRYSAVIFVNGCFWHGHNCHLFKWPKSRPDFWKNKINGNIQRDIKTTETLSAEGWRVGRVWECALKGKTRRDQGEVLDECARWLLGTCGKLEIQGL